MELNNQSESSVSRRGFLKNALVGAGAMTLAARIASAEMLLAGKTAKDIHGMGVEKGLVRINANENPLGASPRAIEAVAQHMFEMNRYAFSTDLPSSYIHTMAFRLATLSWISRILPLSARCGR